VGSGGIAYLRLAELMLARLRPVVPSVVPELPPIAL
jgi:hypothetical protein